jgi:hypothetical protein
LPGFLFLLNLLLPESRLFQLPEETLFVFLLGSKDLPHLALVDGAGRDGLSWLLWGGKGGDLDGGQQPKGQLFERFGCQLRGYLLGRVSGE